MIMIVLNCYREDLRNQTIARILLDAGHNEQTQLSFVNGPIYKVTPS